MRLALNIFARSIVLIALVASPASGADLTLTTFGAFTGQADIALPASGNIIFAGGAMTLPALPSGTPTGQLLVQAGNDIILQNNTVITAGTGWSVTFLAGTNSSVPRTVNAGLGNINLQGSAALASADGSITLLAGNSVTVGTGFVHSLGGGGITVNAVSGSVNTGTKANGFVFRNSPGAPYLVDASLGGISTGAGGNLTITAGQNIASLLPTGTIVTDGGSGAFGATPGNVTLTAGGNVTGHYVVRNGTGTITAGQSAGLSGAQLALSLVSGAWNVTAAQDILLQEVRNPNGIFNNVGPSTSASRHLFDYAAGASLNLKAGNAVQFTGASLPRNSGSFEQGIPSIFPGTLSLSAGAGGVQLAISLLLFPAPNGQLTVTTTSGGSFAGASSSGALVQLVMSDSAATQYASAASFSPSDHAAIPVHLGDPVPVQLNVAGDMNSLVLVSPKRVQLVVGGNLVNGAFTAQNLAPTDVSSVSVAGDILNPSEFTTILPTAIPNLAFFACAVDQPSGLTAAAVASLASRLSYDPIAQTLTFRGRMTAPEELALVSLTVQCPSPEVVQPLDPASAQALYTASQSVPGYPSSGFLIAGPGLLNLQAHNLDLGFTTGLQSVGPAQNPVLAALGTSGAAININLSGNLNLISTAISSIAGGGVTVNAQGSIQVGSARLTGSSPTRGIFTSVDANVTVLSGGDIEISGSRIAAYDGGNIMVSSLHGNVDVGLPATDALTVTKVFGNPVQTSAVVLPVGGILALTFPPSNNPLASDQLVGNISVLAGENILFGCGALTETALNHTFNSRASVLLQAGGIIALGSTNCLSVAVDGTLTARSGSSPGFLNAYVSPADIAAVAGSTVQFSVYATGIAPFAYQWFKEGATLAGATDAVLSLSDIQRADAGRYSVVVSNLAGTVMNYVQLRVLVPQLLSATLVPTNQTLTVSFNDASGGLLTAQDIASFVVQTSTNLVDWTSAKLPLSTNDSGGLWFQLPVPSDPGSGFYRVLSQ